MNIQKTLDELQPYVIGIRYDEGTIIVDAVFKSNWTLPQRENILTVRASEEVNYYLIYSDNDTVLLDDLLIYVRDIITYNQENEDKQELLAEKILDLRKLFLNNPLRLLQTLNFTFNSVKPEEIPKEAALPEVVEYKQPTPVIIPDELLIQSNLTEEEIEMLEEERRAESFRRIKEANGGKNPKITQKPPVQIVKPNSPISQCNCSEEEACPICIDRKGY